MTLTRSERIIILACVGWNTFSVHSNEVIFECRKIIKTPFLSPPYVVRNIYDTRRKRIVKIIIRSLTEVQGKPHFLQIHHLKRIFLICVTRHYTLPPYTIGHTFLRGRHSLYPFVAARRISFSNDSFSNANPPNQSLYTIDCFVWFFS